MSFFNTIRTAVYGITGNKLRAILTTLGIIIGVASVIAMLALGNGARAAVEANFRFLGSDIVQINVKREWEQGDLIPVGKILSYEDGLAMAGEVDLVRQVIMSVGRGGKVRRSRNAIDLVISGVTADALLTEARSSNVQPVDWPDGQRLTAEDFIAAGRFFTPAEVLAGIDVCVLGYQVALDLFEGDNPLDETVWVDRRRCLVVGVLKELEVTDPSLRNRVRPNEVFYLPISTAVRNLYEEEPSVSMSARIANESRMTQARTQIVDYLRRRHQIEPDTEGNYEDDFEIVTRQDILGAQQESARTFAFLLAAMATVSLIVGGIGIMNVMLVSVTERTREIGVRLAVGARGRDIVAQFLLEAMLISAIGGIVGISVGILSIPLAASLNQGVALLAPESIPLAFGVSLLTGVVFGIYPAMRASRLDPIEALRYE